MRIFLILMFIANVHAYETDQHSTYNLQIKDSTEVIDAIINNAIDETIENWTLEKNEFLFIERFAYFVALKQLEHYLNLNPQIDKWHDENGNIFRGVKFRNSFPIWWKGTSSTISVNDIHIGTDKFSHFFGVGRTYYAMFRKEKNFQKGIVNALKAGYFSERWIWGLGSDNVFSNADLATNYDGFLFYLSLFHDDVIPGKKAIIKFVGNRPIKQRPFSFRDHVTKFWNEKYLPSFYGGSLGKLLKKNLMVFCSKQDFKENFNYFMKNEWDALYAKYKKINFYEKAFQFRMDNLCQEYDSLDDLEQKKIKNNFYDINKKEQKVYAKKIPTRGNIPGCKNVYKRSEREHSELLKVKEHITPILKTLVDDFVNDSKYGLSSDQFVSNHFENYEINILQNDHEGFWGVYNTKLEVNNIDYETTIKIDELADQKKICTFTKVPLEGKFFKYRPLTSLTLKYCFSSNESSSTENFGYIYQKKMSFNKKTRQSLDGFIDFNDKYFYVYRTQTLVCKWY